MKALLEKFSGLVKNGKGQITLEEFGSYLELPISDSLRQLFLLYDRVSSRTYRDITQNFSFLQPITIMLWSSVDGHCSMQTMQRLSPYSAADTMFNEEVRVNNK